MKTTYKILITPRSFGKSSSKPLDLLKEKGYEVVQNPYGRIMTRQEMMKHIVDVDGIIVGVDPLDREVLACGKRLKAISKYGVGTDNIDVEYAKEKNIPVMRTVGANAEAVADFTFALMLAVARRIVEIDAGCRKLNWNKITSIEVHGKTLGLIGLGAIGKKVARRAAGFDMKVLAFDTFKDEVYAKENGITYVTLEELLKESDFISLHLPLTDETRNLISYEQFKMMKPMAVIVNTARGGIIDENALLWALKEKRIWGAGIDVFEEEPPKNSELLKMDNIVIGSHCAASTYEAIEKMGMMAAENLIECLEKHEASAN
ncbi:phosphoglycerate dehydrogenase [Tepidanaerobacter sp. GT38]|uniref:phosphoglycerate dehydrogenase n=1 Tax=Tepidanaerobacter sp. GT38 TaxID=2722793 RepID=UPI001F2489F6|nr:phosphoglycerate dehydrogenase [Tepidanaerobacter sp. GT38]MCG1013191.1 phosphoglycerate dehydrogenase [Tepidanaerobacter sp. GT38]